jgi:hypothetical protein
VSWPKFAVMATHFLLSICYEVMLYTVIQHLALLGKISCQRLLAYRISSSRPTIWDLYPVMPEIVIYFFVSMDISFCAYTVILDC